MKKLKSLFCFAIAALLTGTTAISNSNNNNKNIMNQNVENVGEVQREGEEQVTRTLRLHVRLDGKPEDNVYHNLYVYIWETAYKNNKTIAFSGNDDGYGIVMDIELSTVDSFKEATNFGIILKYGAESWDYKIGGDRFFTVPLEFTNGVLDVYTINDSSEVQEFREGNSTALWYVQMIARKDLEKESTKAQLKYSFNVDGEGESAKYTFYNMKMNLGAIIPKTKIDNLEASRISIVEYGVALAKTSVLTENKISLTDAMINKEKEARQNLANSTSNNSYSYVNIVSRPYSEGFSYTDSTGIEKEGDHVIFNANLKYASDLNFSYSVTAVAYFKYDIAIDSDEKVYELFTFLNPRTCSVGSLAEEYTKSESFSTFSKYVQGSLTALTMYKVD